MKGTVIDVNRHRGMVAVHTSDGELSVFELFGDDVEVGDVVQWEGDYPLGGETIRNLTQHERIEVYFQNHCVPKAQLKSQLLYE